MKESDFQTEFRDKNEIYGCFELKFCNLSKKKSLPLSCLSDHQRKSLLACSSEEGFFHKITDPPVFKNMETRFNKKRPFDCFNLNNQLAFVVIMFWISRKRKNVYYIDIERFINIENKYERKSITEAIADLEATYYYDYFKK